MYASNLSSEFYKNVYKEHLGIWNGFTEGNPKKSGFEDFDNEDEAELQLEMEGLISAAQAFYDREVERYEE
jgi:hypothetical protein